MAMLDGLRNVFVQSLKFCKSKVAYDILIEKWNNECEEVYKYKQSLIAEERAKHQPAADVVEVKQIEIIRDDLKWWLETNSEKGVVYIPKYVVENMIAKMDSQL